MSSRSILLFAGYITICLWPVTSHGDDARPSAELISVNKIWDAAPHNAFTDLIRWQDAFYCAFREGKGHAGDIGSLRILRSSDGDQWESAGLLSMAEYDLRDAAICEMPDGRIMVLGGVQRMFDGVRRTGTFVSFSEDGDNWTEPQIVVDPGRWLWRVTWHGDTAYGVAYGAPDHPGVSSLLATHDGIQYQVVAKELLDQGGRATEARVRFDDSGRAYILHRRDSEPNSAFLGIASPPYTDWTWHDLGVRIGGPNFVQIPSGQWIAAGRLYDGGARTELMWLDTDQKSLYPILRLPSGGDTSYPGLVWHEGLLWVSYYSSHEGRTSIYLAKVKLE